MATRQRIALGRASKNNWRARVRHHSREVYLGTFKTQEEAEKAEDEFREQRSSEFSAGVLDD